MAINNLFPASERFHECLVCKESVYNPLCPACISQQIEVWLISYPKLSKKLLPDLKKYVIAIHNEMDGAVECAACTQKRAAVCPYCFTEYVLNRLRMLGAEDEVVGEFLQFFNFDFDRTGYTEDAEELGLLW